MEPTLFEQILSTSGALLVLGAYVLNLTHRLEQDSAGYASMNLAGSSALGYVALQSGRLGLILIEVAWAIVSLIALGRAVLRRGSRAALPKSPDPR